MFTGRRWVKAFSRFASFGFLCLVSGSRWLLDDAVPGSRSSPTSIAAGCLVASLSLLLWKVLRPGSKKGAAESRRCPRVIWRAVLAGALLLTTPALSAWVAGRYLGGSTASLCLALTPVFLAVAMSAGKPEGDLPRLLWPCLTAITGLLLLLPQPNLGSWRPDVAYLAMPLLTMLSAMTFKTFGPLPYSGREVEALVPDEGKATLQTEVFLGRPEGSAMSLILSLVLAALLFVALGWTTVSGAGLGALSAVGTALDAITVSLTLFVLLYLGPLRWSAKFLLIPFTTVLEGVILLRPALTARSWVGLAFLLLGGGVLLCTSSEESRGYQVPR